jgi:hypothetical protein
MVWILVDGRKHIIEYGSHFFKCHAMLAEVINILS